MHRRRFAVCLLALVFAPHARAQTDLCQAVAHDMWFGVATAPLREQTPLAALTAISAVGMGSRDLVKPGQSIADALMPNADSNLGRKLRDMPPTSAMRLGDSDIWLLDRVDGTLGCHTPMVVALPAGGGSYEIAMPGTPDPSAMCALSALAAVTIQGTPALWIEQSGAFSNQITQSSVAVAALRGQAFAPPCLMTFDYSVSDSVTHAFCDGVDCVPLIRRAQILAMRLRQGERGDSLGAGAIRDEEEGADYRRMAQVIANDTQPAELPSFGVSLDTPYTVFVDAETFPMRLDDGAVYLARIGHGGFGWRQTADTLLELYRFRGDKLTVAGSVYVAARRTGIAGIAIE